MADLTGDGIGSPAVHWYSISPNDAVDLPIVPRAVYVGVTGNLAVEDVKGTQIVFTAVPVGYHPIRPRKVLSTGTTATGLIALY